MRNYLLLISLVLFCQGIGFAQCPHDPTLSPENLVLCPNESDTLWTQTYDSYVWYRNGEPIAGEVDSFYVIDYYVDSGAKISVEATLDGCSEFSEEVLVDGYAFLPPTVTSYGDYTYTGEALDICINDTIILEFGLPYDLNIEWTADGVVLEGETSAILNITSDVPTGIVVYHVCGSPSVCPNMVECLGVELPVRFVDCSTNVDNPSAIEHKIFPNPANHVVNIQRETISEEEDFVIYDHLGRIVKTGKLVSQVTSIELVDLPSGIYMLKAGNQKVQRLVKY